MRILVYIIGLLLLLTLTYVVDALFNVADLIYRFLATALNMQIVVVAEPSMYIKLAILLGIAAMILGLVIHIAHAVRELRGK